MSRRKAFLYQNRPQFISINDIFFFLPLSVCTWMRGIFGATNTAGAGSDTGEREIGSHEGEWIEAKRGGRRNVLW